MYNESEGKAIFDSFAFELLEDIERYINHGTLDREEHCTLKEGWFYK